MISAASVPLADTATAAIFLHFCGVHTAFRPHVAHNSCDLNIIQTFFAEKLRYLYFHFGKGIGIVVSAYNGGKKRTK